MTWAMAVPNGFMTGGTSTVSANRSSNRALVAEAPRHRRKFGRHGVEALDEALDGRPRRPGVGPTRAATHHVRPRLVVPHDVVERFAQAAGADGKWAVELFVAERQAQRQHLARRPRVVPEQPVEQVHAGF